MINGTIVMNKNYETNRSKYLHSLFLVPLVSLLSAFAVFSGFVFEYGKISHSQVICQAILTQSNLSTMATLATEESGRCREVAVMGRR